MGVGIFAKVGVRMATHRRFVAAGPAAVGYWTAALCYSRDEELDGTLPDEAVGLLLGVGSRAGSAFARKLVECGLFERTDSGYKILKYAENGNETKAQINDRRAATAERVKRYRNGVGNAVTLPVTNTNVPGSVSVLSSSESSDASDPNPDERPSEVRQVAARPSTASAHFNAESEWWREGIASAHGPGGTCAPPNQWDRPIIEGAVRAHFPGFTSEDAERAVKESAKQYAKSLKPGFRVTANGYVSYLNTGLYKFQRPRLASAPLTAPARVERPTMTPEEIDAASANALAAIANIGRGGK